MSTFRPLRSIGTALSEWACGVNLVTTVQRNGRIRTAIDYAGMALVWMSRDFAYDDRTFIQRMRAGNWYWRSAGRALLNRPQCHSPQI